MKTILRVQGIAVCSFCLASCTSGSEPRVPLSRYGEPPLVWADCPSDLGGASVQCTQAQVPLDWDERSAGLTSILVRKVSAEGEALGQLWVLDGGPGFAGDSFLNDTIIELTREAGLDLMVPSHRGTVGESALWCSGQEGDSEEGGRVTPDEWPECLSELEDKWGSDLSPFTVRQAALDVAYLMNSQTGRTYVFGGSYGSLWAHRLLLDTDARLDAVLLDSIVPIGASLEWVDAHADRAAEAVLTACREMDSCADRFDGDPLELSRAAVLAYDRGEGCGGDRLSAEDTQGAVHALLDGPPDSWIKLVSLFERLVRCNSDDEEALIRLLDGAGAPDGESETPQAGSPPRYNPLLNRQILYRELYRFDVTEQERAEFERSALARGANSSQLALEAHAFGSSYRRVEDPERPTSPVPTYLLSGRFDPLDPPIWADDFLQSLTHGKLTEVRWAGHSTLRYLGWGERECGRRIFATFLEGSIDLSCVDAQGEVDLGMESAETQKMLELWWSSL